MRPWPAYAARAWKSAPKSSSPRAPGRNDRGLSRKHIFESIEGSLRRLRIDYVDLYQAHRFDYETPLEETMQAFADVVRAGKVHYIGVSEWTAAEIRAAAGLVRELGIQLVSNPPLYSMQWRVIDEEVVPACQDLGLSQIVWSPLAQGVLTGNYLPGAPVPVGSRATDEAGGRDMAARWLRDDVLTRVQGLQVLADEVGGVRSAISVSASRTRESDGRRRQRDPVPSIIYCVYFVCCE